MTSLQEMKDYSPPLNVRRLPRLLQRSHLRSSNEQEHRVCFLLQNIQEVILLLLLREVLLKERLQEAISPMTPKQTRIAKFSQSMQDLDQCVLIGILTIESPCIKRQTMLRYCSSDGQSAKSI